MTITTAADAQNRQLTRSSAELNGGPRGPYDVAWLELGPATGLDRAVDTDQALGEHRLDLTAGVDETSQLEQLAKPDACLAHLDEIHALIIPPTVVLPPVQTSEGAGTERVDGLQTMAGSVGGWLADVSFRLRRNGQVNMHPALGSREFRLIQDLVHLV